MTYINFFSTIFHIDRKLKSAAAYLRRHLLNSSDFIPLHFTETVITQDLNMLLPQNEFRKIRKY